MSEGLGTRLVDYSFSGVKQHDSQFGILYQNGMHSFLALNPSHQL
jgi:hypothetical protein